MSAFRFVLAVLLGATLTSAGHSKGDEKLATAIRMVTSADNYRFAVRDGNTDPPVEGSFHEDAPQQFQADRIDFFRKGNTLVYRQGDTWQRTRTGTLSDPLPILVASAKVRGVRLPHEELATLAKATTQVKRTEGEGGTIFIGELADTTAQEVARTEDRDVARGGSIRWWLDGEGRLTKYEVAIRVKGRRGDAEVDGVVTKTVTVRAVGTTKIEVPAAAKKALE